ncbi:MAG: aminomethyl-transferring glycine dehydrogenase subunit GcvPA [Thermomicrobiales bacterium]
MTFNPHTDAERQAMLETIGVSTIAELVDAIPEDVRFPELDLPPRLTELEAELHLASLATANTIVPGNRNFLGAGSYRHYSPATVSQLLLRGEIFTAYTPYQPEVSQGTLQIIYEFQSLAAELLQMDIANASMYDGATALAEATLMAVSAGKGRNRIVIAGTVHPNYREVIATYCSGLHLDLVFLPASVSGFATTTQDIAGVIDEHTAAVIVQYPNFFGTIEDLAGISHVVHEHGAALVVASYPIPLALLKPPGAFGADIATAEGQSLGLAQSLGGPYVGLLAAKQSYARLMPGRLAGMTTDSEGKRGYVLTLQTREQHIRREKATSNICTNQGLMATAATIYMSLVGAEGLREVARRSYANAHYLAGELAKISGVSVANGGEYFNEFVAEFPVSAASVSDTLVDQGFQPGLDLTYASPDLGNFMLIATTELNDRAGIDEFVGAIGAAIR